jgi:OmpR-family two-component system manganese-sensing sensor histidine kinase
MVDLALGTSLMVGAVGAIGWLLSGIAMAPVRDSYQQLKQFTADASHELRNPIAVIQTNAQVALLDPEPEVAVLQQQFQVVERLTRRLGQLVDDLLFLTRQDSGLLALTPRCIDLDPLLSEVVEEQQVLAREGQIHLQLQSPTPRAVTPGYAGEWGSSPGLVWGDRDQLTRLFTNLIGNALQYTSAGGQVSLHWQPIRHQGQPWLQVVVQDNGMGIAPEALAHIFDRFYRADPARRRRGDQGSGLGLAIARAIVENHGGTIQVQSQLQQGTTVTVLLPQTEERGS